MDERSQVRTASGLNIIAGIWLILSPFLIDNESDVMATNVMVSGLIIGIFALIRYFAPADNKWMSWVNAALGVWLVVSPFILGYFSTAMLWNSIITGIIVLGLSVWSRNATTEYRREAATA